MTCRERKWEAYNIRDHEPSEVTHVPKPRPYGGRLIIALGILAASIGFLANAIDISCRYGDAYHDWQYEAVPPGVVRPSDAAIERLDVLCGRWAIVAVGAGLVMLRRCGCTSTVREG